MIFARCFCIAKGKVTLPFALQRAKWFLFHTLYLSQICLSYCSTFLKVTHKQQRYASQIRDGLLETGITQQQLGCVVDAMLVSSHKVDRHSFLKRIKEKTPLTTNVRRFFYNAIEQLDGRFICLKYRLLFFIAT